MHYGLPFSHSVPSDRRPPAHLLDRSFRPIFHSLWGASDRLISVRDADVFEELIPNSRKVIFEDTGHMAMLERPAAFNELLKGFLGEQPAS